MTDIPFSCHQTSMTLSQRLLKSIEPEGAVETLRRFILAGNCSGTWGFVVDAAFETIDPVGDPGLAKYNADNMLRLDFVVLVEVEPVDFPKRSCMKGVFEGLRDGEEGSWLSVVVVPWEAELTSF